MSEYERIKGKIKSAMINELDLEETCQVILIEAGHTPIEDHEDYPYSEQLQDEFYKEYIIYNETLYKIVSSEDVEEEDIYIASMNPDKTISFEVSFYNGGQSFDEAVGTALDQMFKDDKRLRERT